MALRRGRFAAGVAYVSPLRYVVLSQTGLALREDCALDSKQAGRVESGAEVAVAERRLEPSQARGERLMRVRLSSPCAGWASELPKFFALAEGQAAPELSAAAPHEELRRREAAAFNERGEDLRLTLDRNCRDLVALRRGLDVARLKQELEAVEREHAFLEKPAIYSYEAGAGPRGWGSIPLRSIGGAAGEEGILNTGVQKGGEYMNTPVMEKCCPYIRQVVEEIPAKRVLRVRLMRLRPGGVIAPHRDHFLEHCVVRLHAPIVTHKDVEFKIRGSSCRLEEGTLYFANVRQVHEGENRSDLDRIHLVVDVEANLALQDLLRA